MNGIPGNTPLESAISGILRERSVSFKEFMEKALYDPRWGYYSGGTPPGRKADYFTSVSVGSCFGELLAGYLHQNWLRLGSPGTFTVLEQGGHQGTLAADILQVISASFPAFYESLRFVAVERSRQAMGDPRLQEWSCWELQSCLDSIETGSIDLAFSNELLDAFPVHRVTWTGHSEGWREVYLASSSDPSRPLATKLGPLSTPLLADGLSTIDTAGFEPAYTTELNCDLAPWLERMAHLLRPGAKLLIIDYGLSEEAYYLPSRRTGTLQAYRDHRRVPDLLAQPGEQDLTAHINFSRVAAQGNAAGLQVTRFEEQQRFLTALAEEPLLAMEARLAGAAPDAVAAQWIRQFQQLTSMGPTFQAMELTNGVGRS